MDHRYHAAIIGGSYAGMSAALQLARARRRIVVIDAGQRRNRYAATSHGFLGNDGGAPDAIAAHARAQLLAYPNVDWIDGCVTHAQATAGGFALQLQHGAPLAARRLVLAVGVVDTLPAIDGVAERWGRSVFHCPYCHGYELDEGRIGVLASSELAMHHALMLPDWGTVTLFLNASFMPDAAQAQSLAQRGVTVETAPVRRIVDAATVELADGRALVMDGLFAAPKTAVTGTLARQLGCAFDDGPLGAYLRTDAMKATSVAGVFACGDAARAAGNVALAVGDGAMAGAAAHQSLLVG